jgi:hypothetical protein
LLGICGSSVVVSDLDDVEEGIDRVKKLSTKLAEHYCENERTFNVDEFLETFREFCENIKSCQQVSYFVTTSN